jgi:hypothetical protein
MRPLGLILGIVAFAGLSPAATEGRVGVRLVVSPTPSYALEPTRIDVRAAPPTSVAQLRVRAVRPSGAVSHVRTSVVRKGLRRGTFRFPAAGNWQLLVTNPVGRRVPGVDALAVRVLAPRPTRPPAGFGPLGQPGCSPASPRDPGARGTPDVFGTAFAGEQFWALPFVPQGAAWGRRDAAVFDGVVGKEIKIVFGMTSFHAPFRAVGDDGTTLAPVWGPSFHVGSNWDRQPGVEWGAGFVFPATGCWRIAAGETGSLYFLVRS